MQPTYQFTSTDILNTSLIDAHSGLVAYDITTACIDSQDSTTKLGQLSQSDQTESTSSRPSEPGRPSKRRTTIQDSTGATVCDISWNGRLPEITIGDELVGPLKSLFGSTGVPFRPNVLTIPSRFDPDWVWTATSDSLVLLDHSTETCRGAFYHNVVRLAGKGHFINARIPGLGHNYLSLPQHDTVSPVEFIVSFIMLEIVRRGRFQLTPYSFERAKYWQLEEARDLILRRIRRSTI
ncbi:hypothetical protein ONZ45_g366 [Pleurotus djamor]|nr:hypothetical protein ONZ45_g366 [Pleurotus djamor]